MSREKLWKLLESIGIKGKLFNLIKNMYNQVQTCVKNNMEFSDYFESHIGLRQGCMLSPLSFSLFINELAEQITSNCANGVHLFPSTI